jgi:hypothetical protein
MAPLCRAAAIRLAHVVTNRFVMARMARAIG